jgi:Protein of unknown function (DUF3179)
VYGREVDGRVLSFGHAGILYEKSFVMYDRERDSLWVHVTGRVEAGPLKGQRLRFFPSTVTTWAQWKAAYPHTLVLPGRRRDGFMGTYEGAGRPDELGLVVVVRFRGKLYPFATLAESPLVHDQFEDTPLIVYYSRGDGTAVAWQRRVGRVELTFEETTRTGDGGTRLLRDRQTGTLWSWLRGQAVQGALAGTQLDAVAYNPILIDRFHAFYPGGPTYER